MTTWKILVFVLLLVTFTFACQSLITNSGKLARLSFSLVLADAPPDHSIFHLGRNGNSSLAKSLGLVEDTVLLLHCDADSGRIATDASAYANDALLLNVQREATHWGNGLVFNGRNSYGWVEHQPQLNGTFGLTISCRVFVNRADSASGQQTLISKVGSNKGYELALSGDRILFRVAREQNFIQLLSNTKIEPEKWYHIQAEFGGGSLTLFVDDRQDASMSFQGPISPSDQSLWIGGRISGLNILTSLFSGIIDEIAIKTITRYLDIDLMRIMVLDFSKFNTMDEFYASDLYQRYEKEYFKVVEAAKVLSWEAYKRLWSGFFPVVADQTLQIKGGYAEGLVNAAEGLNKIVVSAIKGGKVVYYGEGQAAADKRKVHTARIVMWPAENEQP